MQRVPFPPHGTLAAWRFGDGEAVLLVHGFEDDNSLWDPMAAELMRLGRSFVAFDAPGHGVSDGHWGLGWDFTDGVHAVAEALGPIDAVVAHSVSVIGPERTNFDTAHEFSRLAVPVLVVHSSDDERMPVEDSRRCVPSCPTAELLEVADLGHRKTARDGAVVTEVGAFSAVSLSPVRPAKGRSPRASPPPVTRSGRSDEERARPSM